MYWELLSWVLLGNGVFHIKRIDHSGLFSIYFTSKTIIQIFIFICILFDKNLLFQPFFFLASLHTLNQTVYWPC